MHSSFAFSCKHPFWVLAAPSAEVQMAWVNAFWQVGHSVGAGAGAWGDVQARNVCMCRQMFVCASRSQHATTTALTH